MSLGPPPAWRRTFPQGYGWRGACVYELAIVCEETALRGAEVLRNLSQRAGVATGYQRARDIFIAISGVEPD